MRPFRGPQAAEAGGRPLTGLLSRTAAAEVFGSSAVEFGEVGSGSPSSRPRRSSASTPSLPAVAASRAAGGRGGRASLSGVSASSGSLVPLDKKIARDFGQREALRSSSGGPADAARTAGARAGLPGETSSGWAALERPSTVVRHENFKKERYTEHIESTSRENNDSQPFAPRANSTQTVDGGGEGEVEALLKAFNEGVETMNNEITDAWASIRMSDMSDKMNGKETSAQREARRRREAARENELRRARKKEQDARDPKRKVALRLENKRRFEMESVNEAKGIPFRPLEVHGENGVERIPLVDVRLLQSRCTGLDERGVNVAGLLERRRYLEKAQQVASMTSTGMPGANEARISDQSWGDRQELASTLKAANYAAEMLRCFGHMRGALPKEDAARIDVLRRTVGEVQQGEADRLARMSASGALTQGSHRSMQDYWGAIDARLVKKISHPVLGPGASPPQSPGNRYNVMAMSNRSVAKGNPLGRPSRVPKPCPRRARRWSIVRAAFGLIRLLLLIRRKNLASNLILSLLRQQSKKCEITNSLHRFKKKVRTVQHACREFIFTMRERLDHNEEVWKELEEKYLPIYFEAHQKKILDDKLQSMRKNNKRQAERKKAEQFYRQVTAMTTIDYNEYATPAAIRRAVLRRFYTQSLRRKARSSRSFAAAAQEALTAHRELQGFLQNFGGRAGSKSSVDAGEDAKQSGPAVPVVEQRPVPQLPLAPTAPPVPLPSGSSAQPNSSEKLMLWWELNEEVVFTLIAFVAQTLTTAVGFEAALGEEAATKLTAAWKIHPGVKKASYGGGMLFYRLPVETAPADCSRCTGDLEEDVLVRAVIRRFDLARVEQAIARREHNPTRSGSQTDGAAIDNIPLSPGRKDKRRGSAQTAAVSVAKSMDLEEVLASLTPRLGEMAGLLPADELDESEMRVVPRLAPEGMMERAASRGASRGRQA